LIGHFKEGFGCGCSGFRSRHCRHGHHDFRPGRCLQRQRVPSPAVKKRFVLTLVALALFFGLAALGKHQPSPEKSLTWAVFFR
jgi:hypothetical protein